MDYSIILIRPPFEGSTPTVVRSRLIKIDGDFWLNRLRGMVQGRVGRAVRGWQLKVSAYDQSDGHKTKAKPTRTQIIIRKLSSIITPFRVILAEVIQPSSTSPLSVVLPI
jgi:hypothetical protein